MGWSCTLEAGQTMDRIFEITRKQTLTSGVFQQDGKYFNVEISSREHEDGAITGSIWILLDYDPASPRLQAVRINSFRIEPDGNVSRGHRLKRLLKENS